MINTVDVALSGTFDSLGGYVTIDGTKYTSAQTLTVAKGTGVKVYCGGYHPVSQEIAYINLNGTNVAQGTTSTAAEYTFAVTDNCTVVLSKGTYYGNEYYSAAITMPA